ncbi:MAG: hypothetical protein AB1625_06380 [Acidobacteriota bacterium]
MTRVRRGWWVWPGIDFVVASAAELLCAQPAPVLCAACKQGAQKAAAAGAAPALRESAGTRSPMRDADLATRAPLAPVSGIWFLSDVNHETISPAEQNHCYNPCPLSSPPTLVTHGTLWWGRPLTVAANILDAGAAANPNPHPLEVLDSHTHTAIHSRRRP